MRFFLSFKKEIIDEQHQKIVANPQTIAAVALLTIAQMTLADGFNDVNNIAVKVRQGIYVLVGTICGITMLWFFLQAKSGRKTWGDFFRTQFVCGWCRCIYCLCYLSVYQRRFGFILRNTDGKGKYPHRTAYL